MAIAYGVGILVSIVAVILWLMIMMLIRGAIAFIIENSGVSGVIIILLLFVFAAIKYGNISIKLIWMGLKFRK